MQAETHPESCLHLVVKSTPAALDRCRSQFETGDSVLFLDDGVMHALEASGESFGLPLKACFFARVDLQARGLLVLALENGANPLTDQEAAELMLAHELCLTWK
jgi:sulfur relay protein TusB/DsrH